MRLKIVYSLQDMFALRYKQHNYNNLLCCGCCFFCCCCRSANSSSSPAAATAATMAPRRAPSLPPASSRQACRPPLRQRGTSVPADSKQLYIIARNKAVLTILAANTTAALALAPLQRPPPRPPQHQGFTPINTAAAASTVAGPPSRPPQVPSPAALATSADNANADTATARAVRPVARLRGLSLRWVVGRGSAAGAYRTVNPASRAANVEAALSQARGVVAAQPCTSCARGGGPFTECVVLAGQLLGSCANCHYGSEGARCSFRTCKYIRNRP